MIDFAHVVYMAFLPSLAFGIAIGIGWRFVEPGRVQTAMQWIASILFFVPQPFALWLGTYSAGLRMYQQALLALWGLGIGALFVAQRLGLAAGIWPRTTAQRWARVGAAFAMTALGLYCGWNLVGDYLLSHRVIQGTVDDARTIGHTRSPRTYEVTIGGARHNITLDLLSLLARGDYVEADAGAASSTIVGLRRIVHRTSSASTR